MDRPLLLVDGANVVGSVPDGWWRDRRAAARRLRDSLRPLAANGLPTGPIWAVGTPLDVVLVLEGAARGIDPVDGVRIAEAPGSGDDLITELAAAADPPCLVITADRGLRTRVERAGASVLGPRSLPYGEKAAQEREEPRDQPGIS
jgi:hypothetical protein